MLLEFMYGLAGDSNSDDIDLDEHANSVRNVLEGDDRVRDVTVVANKDLELVNVSLNADTKDLGRQTVDDATNAVAPGTLTTITWHTRP